MVVLDLLFILLLHQHNLHHKTHLLVAGEGHKELLLLAQMWGEVVD